MTAARFAKLAWAALGYNLLVIGWGAYVRASGSGAGCGAHWPLCNGEVLPVAPAVKTLVEFSHRLTSGLALVFAVVLAAFAWRTFERGAPVRRAALSVLGLTVVEALIGAALVLFELVAHDASMKRALSMVLHLGNTFLLLAALTLTAHLASREAAPRTQAQTTGELAERAGSPFLRVLLPLAAVSLMVVAMSGGIAALGDTLFPATTFAEGLRQELSAGAHVLLKLRVLHPVVAVVAAALVMATAAVARSSNAKAEVTRASHAVSALVIVQMLVGLLNLGLLAPIWVQLVHLLVADLLWIALMLLWVYVREDAQDLSTTRLRPERLAS